MADGPSEHKPRDIPPHVPMSVFGNNVEGFRPDFEEHFARLHSAMLDMRGGDASARTVLHMEIAHCFENDSEAELAIERISRIAADFTRAKDLAEANAVLVLAKEIAPYSPILGASFFELAAEHGLSAGTHGVARCAYLEIATIAIATHNWSKLARYAEKALDLRQTADETSKHAVDTLTAHALLGISYSAQCQTTEAVEQANNVLEHFSAQHDFFERLLRYGLPHEAQLMYAAVDAIFEAARIFKDEVLLKQLEKSFVGLIELLDVSKEPQLSLKAKVLFKYASDLHEIAEYINEDDNKNSVGRVLDAALHQADLCLELMAAHPDWQDQKLLGQTSHLKADIFLQYESYEDCLRHAQQALLAYAQSEAFGVPCLNDRVDAEEVLRQAQQKIDEELEFKDEADDEEGL